jgi:ZIP family zinc transporter
MHCLPAFHNRETKVGEEIYQQHGLDGLEVTEEVFESPRAIAYELAPEEAVMGLTTAVALASGALGGAINLAFLAAVFVSNLPEGVAGSINLRSAGIASRRIFWLWTALVLVSAASAALGYAIVVALPTVDGRVAQAFAAGAMLAMLADAMMPEAFEHGGNLVGLCTVFGFIAAAMLSFMA